MIFDKIIERAKKKDPGHPGNSMIFDEIKRAKKDPGHPGSSVIFDKIIERKTDPGHPGMDLIDKRAGEGRAEQRSGIGWNG